MIIQNQDAGYFNVVTAHIYAHIYAETYGFINRYNDGDDDGASRCSLQAFLGPRQFSFPGEIAGAPDSEGASR